MRKLLTLALVAVALSACSGNPEPSATAPTTTVAPATTLAPTTTEPPATTAAPKEPTSGTVPNVVGRDLQLAQDTMQAAGYYNLESRDSSGQGRMQVLDRNWKVVRQSPRAGTHAADGELIVLTVCKIDVDPDCHL
jgi:hypothetical protein